MRREDVIALTFTVIVALFIIGTGQWAYGNLYGPLHNYSKKPMIEIVSVSAHDSANHTYIALNITDVDGPDAYQTSVPIIVVSNSTYTMTLNSTQLYEHTIRIVQAPWNLNKKDSVSSVGGLELWLGSEATYLIATERLEPGVYTLTLLVPEVPAVSATFTVSVGV
ncbi:MAG: TQO small subunit DoxA domain-containing protein [Thermoprotei archaeon]